MPLSRLRRRLPRLSFFPFFTGAQVTSPPPCFPPSSLEAHSRIGFSEILRPNIHDTGSNSFPFSFFSSFRPQDGPCSFHFFFFSPSFIYRAQAHRWIGLLQRTPAFSLFFFPPFRRTSPWQTSFFSFFSFFFFFFKKCRFTGLWRAKGAHLFPSLLLPKGASSPLFFFFSVGPAAVGGKLSGKGSGGYHSPPPYFFFRTDGRQASRPFFSLRGGNQKDSCVTSLIVAGGFFLSPSRCTDNGLPFPFFFFPPLGRDGRRAGLRSQGTGVNPPSFLFL